MYQTSFFEHSQGIKQLCRENFHQLRAESLKLILFNELIEIRREELKDETQMIPMYERITESQYMVLVVRIVSLVELREFVSVVHTTRK